MSRRSNSGSGGNIVDREVANLFGLRNTTNYTNALLLLRQKYNDDDLVKKIQDVFIEKHTAIVKGAKKFALAISRKYNSVDIPYHLLLTKARAHVWKKQQPNCCTCYQFNEGFR